jgi:hypothetical protein
MAEVASHSKLNMKTGLLLLAGVCLIVRGECTAFAQHSSPNAESQIEMQNSSLRLALTQKTSKPTFTAELCNLGTQALILNLGMMLANGRQQYGNQIHFQLKGPNYKSVDLEMSGPGVIGGRIDPMVVPTSCGCDLRASR